LYECVQNFDGMRWRNTGRACVGTEKQAAEAADSWRTCVWAGKKYTEGAVVCDNGREMECVRWGEQMRWWDTGRTC
jgi:Protein of unknown function (DUF1496)